jgi:hypothetical protein
VSLSQGIWEGRDPWNKNWGKIGKKWRSFSLEMSGTIPAKEKVPSRHLLKKKSDPNCVQWLTTAIPGTQEVEIGRTKF